MPALELLLAAVAAALAHGPIDATTVLISVGWDKPPVAVSHFACSVLITKFRKCAMHIAIWCMQINVRMCMVATDINDARAVWAVVDSDAGR
jgi:hypothetical protein